MKPGSPARLVPMPVLRGEDRERRAVAEAWLSQAATSREAAGMEWTEQGVALLTAGIVWDAVRLPYAPLGADLDRDADPDQLHRRLDELRVTGPVFCDPYRPHLYVLVPPGTDREWPRTLAPAGVECLGGTRPYIHHVGVPRLDLISPPGPYWVTLPDGTGHLTDPQHLFQVLRARGRGGEAGRDPERTAGDHMSCRPRLGERP
ncbi:hypothetical protein [Streptomyces sp. NBC_00775]|uniref:hypothetical protein n=2 Tax=Streptomyces TaxID=1883 RepID=UPI002ED2A9AF|nr:hypothetical protein OIC96_00260 [Streptomyces sp. NBC_00775]